MGSPNKAGRSTRMLPRTDLAESEAGLVELWSARARSQRFGNSLEARNSLSALRSQGQEDRPEFRVAGPVSPPNVVRAMWHVSSVRLSGVRSEGGQTGRVLAMRNTFTS